MSCHLNRLSSGLPGVEAAVVALWEAERRRTSGNSGQHWKDWEIEVLEHRLAPAGRYYLHTSQHIPAGPSSWH